MTNNLVLFKTLTKLATALETRNIKAITPNQLRELAKTTLKANDNLGK